MPYNVRLPNGVIVENIPDDMPQEEARARILKNFPDVAAEQERTFGEAATDIAASLGTGAGRLLQVPGQIGQLAGLYGPEEAGTGLQGLGQELEEFSQEAKSPTLIGKETLRAQEVQQADGQIAQFGTFLKETVTDPALLTSFFSEQVPNLVGSMGGGMLARGGVSLLMRQASEKALGRAGVAGAVGTGAAMQGADIGTETYERIYKELEEQGVEPEEANRRALEQARKAAIGAAGTTIATSYLVPGGTSIERALAGRGLPGVGGAVRGATGEAIAEGIEEGTGQLLSNIVTKEVIPETDITEGVGQAAASGVLGGGLFGGPAGAISARRDANIQKKLDLARKASEEGKERANAFEQAELEARRTAFEAEKAEIERRIAAERFRDSDAYKELEEKVNKIKETAKKKQDKADAEYAKFSAFTDAQPDLFGDVLPEQPTRRGVEEPTGATPAPVPEGQLELPLPPIMEDTGQLAIPEVGIARARPAETEPLGTPTITETGQLELPEIGVGRPSAQVTEADFSRMGIGKTNRKLRAQILGKDLGIPEQRDQVRTALEEYASDPNRSARIIEGVESFLRRPEFAEQLELGLERMPVTADVTPAGEPTPIVTETSLDGLLLPKRSAARKRLLGKDLSKPEQRAEVVTELKKLAANRQLNEDTRTRVREVLAGSPFIRTQGELFASEEAPSPPPTPAGETDVGTTATRATTTEPTIRRRAGQRGVAVAGVGARTAAPTEGAPGTVQTPDGAGLAPADRGTTPDVGRGAGEPTAVAPTETPAPDFISWVQNRGISITDPNQDWKGLEQQWYAESGQARQSETTQTTPPVIEETTEVAPTNTQLTKPTESKPKKKTAVDKYAEEYELQYAKDLAEMPREVMFSSAAITRGRRVPITPRQRILEMIAADLYAREKGTVHKARAVYNSLPTEERAAIDAAIEGFRDAERRGAIEIQRLDALREKQAELRDDFGPDVANAIRSELMGHTTPELTAAVYKNKLVDALKEIATGKGYNAVERLIARRILEDKKYPLSYIQVVPRESLVDSRADAQYDPATDTISIAEGAVDSHTVLHEAVHGFLHAAIVDFEAGRFENKALSDLRDLYNHLLENAPQLSQMESTRYAMSSLTEFASEAMSNPELQAQLARIPYKDSNIFTKFARFVMDLLGIGPGANNALGAALMYGERSFNFGRMYQQTEGRQGRATPAKVVRATLEDISQRAGGISETPPPKTAFQKIKETGLRNSLNQFLNRAETSWFSSDAGLQNRIAEELRKNRDAQAAIEAVQKISTSQALHADGVAMKFLEKGNAVYRPDLHMYEATDDQNNYIRLIDTLSSIAKEEGVSFERMKQYANQAFIAERINGMSKTDKEFYSNLTDAEVRAGLEFFTAVPRLRELQNIWNGIRQNAMKMAVDSGLYTEQEARDLLNVMDYVPFFREGQLEAGAGPKEYGRGLLDYAKGRKIKGSEQKVNDIFNNMERWTSYIVSRSVKNRTANNMLQLAQEVFPDEVTPIRTDDALKKEERQNVIDIYVGGERKRFKFADPMFVEAFGGVSSIGIPLTGAFGSAFVKAADFLRKTVVLVPIFSISQLSQDSFAAMYTSGLQKPLKIPFEVVNEFFKTLRGTSSAHERLGDVAAAGVRDYSAVIARNDVEISAGLKKPGTGRRIYDALEKFAMASDNAVRQAIYNRTLLETGGVKLADGTIRGGDEATAVRRAFEVINFKRSGNSKFVQVGKQVVPFFGAYLQAMNVMYKVLMGRGISPQQRAQAYATLAATTAKVMTLALLYTALVADDEEYQEMDPTMRDRTLMIPGTSFKLPMRPDIFLLPKLLAEYGYLTMTNEGYTDGTKVRRAFRDAIANAILSPTAVPQAIKPAFEVGINYSFFTGRPIIGRGLERLPTEQQYSSYTSELAKIIGSSGLISPVNVDHLMRGYLGTAGGLMNAVISSAVRAGEGRSLPDVPLPDDIASVPGLGAFVTRTYGTGVKNDFYELRKEVDTAVAGLNWLKKYRTREEVVEFLQANRDLIALRTPTNRIVRRLSELRQQERKVREAPDSKLSAAEKGRILERLKEIERRILEQVPTLRQRAGM